MHMINNILNFSTKTIIASGVSFKSIKLSYLYTDKIFKINNNRDDF